MKRRLWFPALVASSIALAAFGATTPRSARAEDDDEPVKDGKWHYTRQCAGCHNDNGDGKGPTITQLGLQARDFKQGGFAFGDSREQMKRTITSGIPGRSPMPSFKGILDDDEMELVIDYVRTLMPPRDETPPKNTEMIVKDRALIARGKLPPITEGAPEVPRGLLIGTPEGMTFEYDISDVRLLGVRLGRFANREDWGDRGGAFLRPLGSLVYRCDSDRPALSARRIEHRQSGATDSVVCVLESSWARGTSTGVTFKCVDEFLGLTLLRAHERVSFTMFSVGPGFTRQWNVEPLVSSSGVPLTIAEAHISDARPEPWRNWPRGGATSVFTRDLGDEGVEVSFLRSDGRSLSSDQVAALDVSFGRELTVTTLRVPRWSDELGLQLLAEIGR